MPFKLILVGVLLTTASGGIADMRLSFDRSIEVLCIRNASQFENRLRRSVLCYYQEMWRCLTYDRSIITITAVFTYATCDYNGDH